MSEKSFGFDEPEKKYDDGFSNILQRSAPAKSGRKPTTGTARKKQVSCYLDDEEYKQLQAILDGRPAAIFVRNLVLQELNKEK